MKYYTDYKLIVRKIKDKEQFMSLDDEIHKRDLIGYAFDSGSYDECHHEACYYPFEGVTWYEHAKDMVHIAEKFPNMFFELEGTGEDFGDFWKEYYHDMDIEYCRGDIVYEEPKRVQWNDLIMI